MAKAEVTTTAAAFVVALLKNKYYEEAEEFIDWYLSTFSVDLAEILQLEEADDAG